MRRFEQPEQPEAVKECETSNDPCCALDKRACKGKGGIGKAFRKTVGISAKRACKWVKDPTMQATVSQKANNKNYGACTPRT